MTKNSTDIDLFLLGFAQLEYALSLSPGDTIYTKARSEVLERLQREFAVSEVQLLARSLDTYTVSCLQAGDRTLATFPAEEIEDFVV